MFRLMKKWALAPALLTISLLTPTAYARPQTTPSS